VSGWLNDGFKWVLLCVWVGAVMCLGGCGNVWVGVVMCMVGCCYVYGWVL
jgi:hypothetical protein